MLEFCHVAVLGGVCGQAPSSWPALREGDEHIADPPPHAAARAGGAAEQRRAGRQGAAGAGRAAALERPAVRALRGLPRVPLHLRAALRVLHLLLAAHQAQPGAPLFSRCCASPAAVRSCMAAVCWGVLLGVSCWRAAARRHVCLSLRLRVIAHAVRAWGGRIQPCHSPSVTYRQWVCSSYAAWSY